MSVISLISPPSCSTGTLTFRQLYIYQVFIGQKSIHLYKMLILTQVSPVTSPLLQPVLLPGNCTAPQSSGESPLLEQITSTGLSARELSPAVSVLPFLCQQRLQALKWSFRPPTHLPEIKHTPKIYKASLEESCAEVPKQYIQFSDGHKYPATYYSEVKELPGKKKVFKRMCQDLPGNPNPQAT